LRDFASFLVPNFWRKRCSP